MHADRGRAGKGSLLTDRGEACRVSPCMDLGEACRLFSRTWTDACRTSLEWDTGLPPTDVGRSQDASLMTGAGLPQRVLLLGMPEGLERTFPGGAGLRRACPGIHRAGAGLEPECATD